MHILLNNCQSSNQSQDQCRVTCRKWRLKSRPSWPRLDGNSIELNRVWTGNLFFWSNPKKKLWPGWVFTCSFRSESERAKQLKKSFSFVQYTCFRCLFEVMAQWDDLWGNSCFASDIDGWKVNQGKASRTAVSLKDQGNERQFGCLNCVKSIVFTPYCFRNVIRSVDRLLFCHVLATGEPQNAV